MAKTAALGIGSTQALAERPQTGITPSLARVLLEGFDRHYRIFREYSRRAKQRFESGDWLEAQHACRERIKLYETRVAETGERIQAIFGGAQSDEKLWPEIKFHYIGLLKEHKQPELAETFFNTVCCNILHRAYYKNDYIFVRPSVATEHIDSDIPVYRSYYPRGEGLRNTLARIFDDLGLRRELVNRRHDLRCVLRAWRAQLPRPFAVEPDFQIRVLSSLFYRNKGAYLAGQMINGAHEHPFVVPILRDPSGGMSLDAILLTPDQLASLFSASRAYFMVDMEVPSAYVEFLTRMLPNKPKWELYTILGLQKHGKALFYRDFLHHLRHSSDEFAVAPGIEGLVMVVFTLPSFPYVFKIIRDVIRRPKEVTREEVRQKYQLVKYHDRVGRLADTLEYSDVAFPICRFGRELLAELRRSAPSAIEQEGDTLIVKHLYVERRMVPLNIYLDQERGERRRQAILDYGNALRELAAANIFPGDLMAKNFGVTRYRRVVFYDYDEIEYLTNCNFRRIPQPCSDEEQLAADAWYAVAPKDIFPEEFATFLLTDPELRRWFLESHADLLDAGYWKRAQERVAAGIVDDVFPYSQAVRFRLAEQKMK